jgi:hypothetical protein
VSSADREIARNDDASRRKLVVEASQGKIVYVLVRRLLGLAVLVFRRNRAKDAELLALRHQNALLRRHVGRVRYEPTDRVWLAALARLIPAPAGATSSL